MALRMPLPIGTLAPELAFRLFFFFPAASASKSSFRQFTHVTHTASALNIVPAFIMLSLCVLRILILTRSSDALRRCYCCLESISDVFFPMCFLLYSCLPYSLLSIIVSHNVTSIDTILHCIVESFHIIVFYFEMWYAIAFEVKSVLLRSV